MNLKKIRVEKKLTQTELAARSGLRQPLISRLEAGAQALSVAHIKALAKGMGMKPSALMAELDKASGA